MFVLSVLETGKGRDRCAAPSDFAANPKPGKNRANEKERRRALRNNSLEFSRFSL
jgi:hypothetical protein